jgi:hypothetical protein
MKKLVGLTVVAVAVCFAAEPVAAQSPYLDYGCNGAGVGYGSFGQLGSPYALGRIPVPPYFALHPPVYYSHPMPRTYGYSPFAYPGTTETPELVLPTTAKVIRNPHVTPASKQANEIDMTKTARNSQLEILNPFVRTEAQLASYVK